MNIKAPQDRKQKPVSVRLSPDSLARLQRLVDAGAASDRSAAIELCIRKATSTP